jgi:hypothetical protein
MTETTYPPPNSSLIKCISKAKSDGYTDDFKLVEAGLFLKETTDLYFPDQIRINDIVHFTIADDPSENVILYLVETTDGHKGMLINAYDHYADQRLSSLITQVENISRPKSTPRK